jgi:hypothetical protein
MNSTAANCPLSIDPPVPWNKGISTGKPELENNAGTIPSPFLFFSITLRLRLE